VTQNGNPRSGLSTTISSIKSDYVSVLARLGVFRADPELSSAERRRRALRVWVALHGVVMLARQGLLRSGITAASLDQLIEDIIR
jgi:hypothetical protein